MFITKRKTLKEIKGEIRKIVAISDETFDKMTRSEIMKLYRKCKVIDTMFDDVCDFVKGKENPKNFEKPLDKSVKM